MHRKARPPLCHQAPASARGFSCDQIPSVCRARAAQRHSTSTGQTLWREPHVCYGLRAGAKLPEQPRGSSTPGSSWAGTRDMSRALSPPPSLFRPHHFLLILSSHLSSRSLWFSFCLARGRQGQAARISAPCQAAPGSSAPWDGAPGTPPCTPRAPAVPGRSSGTESIEYHHMSWKQEFSLKLEPRWCSNLP